MSFFSERKEWWSIRRQLILNQMTINLNDLHSCSKEICNTYYVSFFIRFGNMYKELKSESSMNRDASGLD